jgi:YVTN family beta-propeller protein
MSGISFAVQNSSGKPVIYSTNDPTLNHLTLTLTNSTGAPLTLQGGAPVSEESISPDGPTSLYLTLGDLLTGPQFQQLQISAEGWNVVYFSDSLLTNWALTPTAETTLPDGGSINFAITNLVASGQPQPGALTIDYYNVPTVDDNSIQAALFLQNPPSGPKDLQLLSGFDGNNLVFITNDDANPLENSLVLDISNPSPTNPIVDPSTPWETNPPVFNLSFVCGKSPGYGALNTAEVVATFQVGIAEQYGDSWKIEPVLQGSTPYWRLLPKVHEILGTGETASIQFSLNKLVTTFDPGITLLYLQHANIPGYNDDVIGLTLVKQEPVPGILSFFSQTPEILNLGQSVQLTWSTFAAARVDLSYLKDGNLVQLSTETGTIALNEQAFTVPDQPDQPITAYNLDAYDQNMTKIGSQSVQITTRYPQPAITSLTSTPRIFTDQTFPTSVDLAWTVANLQYLTALRMNNNVGDLLGKSTISVKVGGPSTFTLTATNEDGAQASGTVSQVSLTGATLNLPFSPVSISLAGKGDFAYMSDYLGSIHLVNLTDGGKVIRSLDSGQGPLTILTGIDGLSYCATSQEAKALLVGDLHQVKIVTEVDVNSSMQPLVSSPDRSRLYVSGTNSVISVIDATQGSYPVIATWTLEDAAQGMAVSPDGKRVYVVYNASLGILDAVTGHKLGVILLPDQGLTCTLSPDGSLLYIACMNINKVAVIDTSAQKVVNQIPVGVLPLAIAVSPDGALVYVANSNMQDGTPVGPSLSVIDMQQGQAVTPFNLPMQSAALLALRPDGGQLYALSQNNSQLFLATVKVDRS